MPGITRGGIFVRDLETGVTTPISLLADLPIQVLGATSLSADGRFIAIQSSLPLVPEDSNNRTDVFIYDRLMGKISRVSVASNGTQGNDVSRFGSLSGDGRFVAFQSVASSLVPDDINIREEIFVHDRLTGETVRLSVAGNGEQSFVARSLEPALSADGLLVAFSSFASTFCAQRYE